MHRTSIALAHPFAMCTRGGRELQHARAVADSLSWVGRSAIACGARLCAGVTVDAVEQRAERLHIGALGTREAAADGGGATQSLAAGARSEREAVA